MTMLPELWQASPKVHMCVYSDISSRLLSTWTFTDIYDEVVKSGITDDDDILATTRALAYLRDRRRIALQKGKTD
jgi:hypothetical protein